MQVFIILFLVLALILGVVSHGLLAVSVPCGVSFTQKEKEAWAMIADVKKFIGSLGFKKTENFKRFSEAESYHMVIYHEKNYLPFSFRDPNIKIYFPDPKSTENSINTVKSKLQAEGLNPDKYDFFFYPCEALSGGAIVTRQLLQTEPERLVFVIIHEDWHDNISLPYHIEEAAGSLMGTAGAAEFLDEKGLTRINKKMADVLKEELNMANAINKSYGELEALNATYISGQIDIEVFKKEQEKLLIEVRSKLAWPELNVSAICFLHGYTYYYPLMHRLFVASKYNLRKTIKILRNIPFKDSDRSLPANEYFRQTRLTEKKVEIYLESIISSL